MIGLAASPRPTYGLGGGMESSMKPICSHGTRKAGITVAEGESDETKKYAVDGIPREYKKGRFTRKKAVSPSPIPYLPYSPHVSVCTTHARKKTKC